MIGIGYRRPGNALRYTGEREQFGKHITNFRACNFNWPRWPRTLKRTADVYNAARMKDAGQNFVKEAAMASLFIARRGTHLFESD